MAIFTQCLARNVFALESHAFVSSPIMLIVPYVVVRELDGLKISARRDRADSDLTVGQKAQRANRWILDAIQQQKKRSYCEQDVSVPIPEHAWILHVESSAFYQTSRRDPAYREESADDEIISHCRSLQRDTHQSVWLCSDDINAKLRAESDAVLTFSIADWVRDTVGSLRGDRDEKLTSAISDLIDQWDGQMGGTAEVVDMSMEQDQTPLPMMGINDSLHAPSTTAVPRAPRDNRVFQPPFNRIPNRQHQYSSEDRSSSSSMWAKR
jgi:predicted ribonuclease YlaK